MLNSNNFCLTTCLAAHSRFLAVCCVMWEIRHVLNVTSRTRAALLGEQHSTAGSEMNALQWFRPGQISSSPDTSKLIKTLHSIRWAIDCVHTVIALNWYWDFNGSTHFAPTLYFHFSITHTVMILQISPDLHIPVLTFLNKKIKYCVLFASALGQWGLYILSV